MIPPAKHRRAYDLTPKQYVEATTSRHAELILAAETSKTYLQAADEAGKGDTVMKNTTNKMDTINTVKYYCHAGTARHSQGEREGWIQDMSRQGSDSNAII